MWERPITIGNVLLILLSMLCGGMLVYVIQSKKEVVSVPKKPSSAQYFMEQQELRQMLSSTPADYERMVERARRRWMEQREIARLQGQLGLSTID